MNGSTKLITAYVAFIELYVLYRKDTFFYGLFSIISLFLAIYMVIKMHAYSSTIKDRKVRSTIKISDTSFFVITYITALYFTSIIGGFYTMIILILETIIYTLFINPKFLNRKFF